MLWCHPAVLGQRLRILRATTASSSVSNWSRKGVSSGRSFDSSCTMQSDPKTPPEGDESHGGAEPRLRRPRPRPGRSLPYATPTNPPPLARRSATASSRPTCAASESRRGGRAVLRDRRQHLVGVPPGVHVGETAGPRRRGQAQQNGLFPSPTPTPRGSRMTTATSTTSGWAAFRWRSASPTATTPRVYPPRSATVRTSNFYRWLA